MELLTRCSDEETKSILRWLSPVNFWLKQEDVCKQREAGTGKWLLEHPDFLEWEKGNEVTLWCCGSRELFLFQWSPRVMSDETNKLLAGVGKTVLA